MQSKIRNLYVAQLPQLLPSDWSNEATLAVVIDTLRFTSTACIALQAGATSVYVAAGVDAARQRANDLGSKSLLCGERHCHRIEGFHLGNSPSEYLSEVVGDRELVFSTTNGTLAVAAVRTAQQVVLASLLNRVAIVKWISESEFKCVWIICAGTDGQVAAEDLMTAGAILAGCEALGTSCVLANDSAIIACNFFHSQSNRHTAANADSVYELLTLAAGGKNLIQSGYSRDISAVAQLDSLSVVPRNSRENPSRFFI